jgi:hypothetical protein
VLCVLVTLGFATGVVCAGQDQLAPPEVEASAQPATASPAVKSLLDEAEIPAFLRTDPCDTEDS